MRVHPKHQKVLVAIILAAAACSAWATPSTSYYIYDESGHVIGEYDANGNTVQEHIYLGDKPIAVAVTSSGTTTLYNVVTDQLNTPRAVIDANKNVVWSWTSDPFGNGQPTGSITYNLRFPGQYYDQETGRNYNHTRDYDAGSGRYIESDPNDLRGGINTYAYVFDNPLGLSDKDGLAPSMAANSGNKSVLDKTPDSKCYFWMAGCINESILCIEAECDYHDCKGHTWTLTINAWLPGGFIPADQVDKLSPNCHCTKKELKKRGDDTEGLQ